MSKLVLTHENEISQLKQQLQLDFLLVHADLKKAVLAAVEHGPSVGKAVRAFKEVIAVLVADGVPGAARLRSASDQSLKELVLKFASPHKKPLEGKVWRWTLQLSTSASGPLREAVADVAAEGGSSRVLVRRPLSRPGPMALALEALVYPERAANRENKGKAKGKGGKEGKGKGRGNAGGRGGMGMGGRDGMEVEQQPLSLAPAPVPVVPPAPAALAPVVPAIPAGSASSKAGQAPAMVPPAGPAPKGKAPTVTYTGEEGKREERSRSPSGPRENTATEPVIAKKK